VRTASARCGQETIFAGVSSRSQKVISVGAFAVILGFGLMPNFFQPGFVDFTMSATNGLFSQALPSPLPTVSVAPSPKPTAIPTPAPTLTCGNRQVFWCGYIGETIPLFAHNVLHDCAGYPGVQNPMSGNENDICIVHGNGGGGCPRNIGYLLWYHRLDRHRYSDHDHLYTNRMLPDATQEFQRIYCIHRSRAWVEHVYRTTTQRSNPVHWCNRHIM